MPGHTQTDLLEAAPEHCARLAAVQCAPRLHQMGAVSRCTEQKGARQSNGGSIRQCGLAAKDTH